MRQFSLVVLILAFSPIVMADEIDDVFMTLGVSKERFDDLWRHACPHNFKMKVPATTLSNKKSIVGPGVKYGFLIAEKAGEKEILIKSGPVCEALRNYYFNRVMFDKRIENFLQKDMEFKSVYGCSVIDAWGLEKYSSASLNGKGDAFILAHWKELEKKELITITTEDSMFNGAPSKAYFSKISKNGVSLNKALHRTSR
jgi:hypothetical protein